MMNLFRLLARRGLRVAMIVLLVGAIFGFGHFMTPRTQDAWAKVVLEGVGNALVREDVPEAWRGVADEGKVQEVYLNDNTLYYALYRSPKRVDDLLDYYENLYSADTQRQVMPPEGRKAVLDRIKDPKKREEEARKLDEVERLVNTHHVRVQQDHWGAFATILTGKEQDADYTMDLVERFRTFKKSGLVEDLGKPKIVVAFADPSQGDTQYFTVWPGAGFDQRKIRPRGEADAPGYDIDDIARPQGSRRMVTFGQQHGGTHFEILVYSGGRQVDGVLDHFLHTMQQEGWSVAGEYASAVERMDEPHPSLLFSKGEREAYVSLRYSEEADEVVSTVAVYSHGG